MSGQPDVLIIGAGAAGLFCALGLKDSASVTVVEAGPDPGTPPPRWMLYDYLLPDECYYHYTDADTGMDLPQGRGTGGGSTVNSAAALRGQPWDFDGWGVPGWTWADCLDGFRAIESDQQFGDADYHGAAGPIPITRLTPGPLDEALIALCAQRGYPRRRGPQRTRARSASGCGRRTARMRGGGARTPPSSRWSGPAVDVRTGTQAHQAALRRDPMRRRRGRSARRAQRRLHADAWSCARARSGRSLLLMSSGIGPEAMVRHAGARLVSRLDGVGANLQDHPWCLLDVDVTDPAAHRGPAGQRGAAALRAARRPRGGGDLPGGRPGRTYPSVPATRVSFTAALMTPLSRGRVTLTPGGVAEVRVRHLADEQDAARMAEIVATTADMIDELAGQGLVRVPDDAWWRADDLAAACRQVAGTYNHHCGTCRMGDPADLPLRGRARAWTCSAPPG